MDFSCIFTMFLLVTPVEFELSFWTGVLGWGQPISMRVCRICTIALEVTKRLASSASVAEDMTDSIVWDMVRMDPLSRGTGSYLYRKMWDPAWMKYLETLRYAASECPSSIMLLD